MTERLYIRVKCLIFSYYTCLVIILRKSKIVNCVLKQNGCGLAGSVAIVVCYNVFHKKKRQFCKWRAVVTSVTGQSQIFSNYVILMIYQYISMVVCSYVVLKMPSSLHHSVSACWEESFLFTVLQENIFSKRYETAKGSTGSSSKMSSKQRSRDLRGICIDQKIELKRVFYRLRFYVILIWVRERASCIEVKWRQAYVYLKNNQPV